MLPVFEILALIGLALACLLGRKGGPRTSPALLPRRLPLSRHRPALVFLFVGLTAFFGCVLAALVAGVPQPAIHDEFSNLLAADTLAAGRLTNPTHPFWKHFETFHVIQQPTYASKYPPAQGLMLACGQFFFGSPLVGVWLAVALAAAATSWMLAGWCPLRWAWWGGLLAAVRLVFSGPLFPEAPGTMAYWSQSYWGGAVAVLGGALIFGALPRLRKHPRGRDALGLGLGLALLANHRPFEGLLVGLPAAAALLLGLVRFQQRSGHFPFRAVGVPLGSILLFTALGMGFYNYRVTGDPLLLPYQVHEARYGLAPVFLWQPLKSPPDYNHQVLREFHTGWSKDSFQMQQTFSGWLRVAGLKLRALGWFYFGLLFAPFLAAFPYMWRRRPVKFALAGGGLLLAGLLAETWAYPHYAAPAAPLVFLLLVEALRQARFLHWRGRFSGEALVRAVLPMTLVATGLPFILIQLWKTPDWTLERARLLKALEQTPGHHLVIVRYGPGHSPHQEWVYNRADIDQARVVWARAMDPEADGALRRYFRDRRAWLLQVEAAQISLNTFPADP
ncbi:MAG: hypothetical protein MUF69_03230 [Desulfobacterota bacterium]|jgi:hypothetical protein|nr:hypothetical protein [Thermodesulfobacteriota bacterium]